MKYVVSVEEMKVDSLVDPRFGRSPYYAVVDSETADIDFIENVATVSGHGAGIQAAQNVIELGVSAVVTGHVGPNAWRVLQAADISVFQVESIPLTQVIADMKTGNLIALEGATGPGHAGMGQGRG